MQHDLQLLDDAKNFYFPYLEEYVEIYKIDDGAITPKIDQDGCFKLYTSRCFETTLAPNADTDLEFDYYLGLPQSYIGVISAQCRVEDLLFIDTKTWLPEERYHRFRIHVKNISNHIVKVEPGSFVAKILVLSCYRTCTAIREIKTAYNFYVRVLSW